LPIHIPPLGLWTACTKLVEASGGTPRRFPVG
jgi:hypothetical protein